MVFLFLLDVVCSIICKCVFKIGTWVVYKSYDGIYYLYNSKSNKTITETETEIEVVVKVRRNKNKNKIYTFLFLLFVIYDICNCLLLFTKRDTLFDPGFA